MRVLIFCFSISVLNALPTLPHIAAGTATTAEENSALHVTASDRTIIDWESFSIGAAETVSFHQPSPSATVLNRVTGIEVSELMGALKADGHVYLVNPNGIIVSKEAVINTASFFAFTNPVSSDAFLKGELLFDGSSQAPLVHSGKISLIHENGKVFLKTDGPLTLQGTIEAREIRGEAGVMSLPPGGRLEGASIALVTEKGPIYNEGLLKGGEISLCIGKEAPLYQMGTLEGTAISIRAPRCLQDGSVTGKTIAIETEGAYIETAKGKIAGDAISVISKTTLFSSGHHRAPIIHLLGNRVTLCAAELDASSEIKGGEILIGGDLHGANPLVPNAKTTYLNGSVKVLANGSVGGKIIVWSDEKTECFGDLDASGVARGGFIEVSGGELYFGGHTSVGGDISGEILFDPESIVISASLGVYPQYELIDPNVGNGTGFGAAVAALSTGNIVVTKPTDNFGAGTTSSGAAYLYDGLTAALISTLNGSTSGDRVGSGGILKLTGNGNFVIPSPNWGVPGGAGTVGAVTWGNGTTGIAGTVSAGNSFLGTTAGDRVGSSGVVALTNGNYAVRSPSWSNPAGAGTVGAATWGNGTNGTFGPGGYGTVSIANSLIGSTLNDQISSSGITALTNGNYAIASLNWDSGATINAGAATWANGTNGTFGPGGYGAVSAANSFIGSTAGDQVSSAGITALTNGNYVVASQLLDSGATNVGAATWGNGTNGTFGPGGYGAVSAANSFVGAITNDQVSSGGIKALTNGNYVISTPNWNLSAASTVAGAATWGNGTNGTFGPGGYGAVSSANSFVGAIGGCNVSSSAITVLTNGNYVVKSASWDLSDATVDVGAATWGNGTNGTFGPVGVGGYGTVSLANSFIGSTASDQIGTGGVALTNGNYVITSRLWDLSAAITNVGAATWGNGTNGTFGPGGYGAVSAANSFIGSTTNDQIGFSNAIALTNGNYVVGSRIWNLSAATTAVGAATWGNGTNGTFGTGTYGTVSDANSFIGSTTNDHVASFSVGTALTNGNYVVSNTDWDSGATADVGAATWGNGTNGTFGTGSYGTISIDNSFIGSTTNDNISSSEILALTNGNYVVSSANWDLSGATTNAGAVTWGNGSTGQTIYKTFGTVSALNSIIGLASSADLQTVVEDSVNTTFICPFLTEGTGRIRIGIYDPDQMTYARAQAQTMTIQPALLTTFLDSGDNVTLQANDNITISDPITVSASGSGGTLSAAAGKSIAINANITTDNGDLTLTGNASLADGVVDAFRTAGTATIAIANGVTINVGSGNLFIDLADGAGKTFSDSGNISLGDMATLQASGAGTITIETASHSISLGTDSLIQCQHGSILLTAGENITATGAMTIQATGTGTVTMVVDTLFPTSPGVGTGKFDIGDVTLTTGGGFLRLYAGEFGLSTFPPLINGVAYTPGSQVNELYGIYYPSLGAPLVAGDPFIVFYKASASSSGVVSSALSALSKSDAAISEPFQMWTPTMYGGYLGYDLYPPTWTAKDLNLTIPFLVDLFAGKEKIKLRTLRNP